MIPVGPFLLKGIVWFSDFSLKSSTGTEGQVCLLCWNVQKLLGLLLVQAKSLSEWQGNWDVAGKRKGPEQPECLKRALTPDFLMERD